MKRQQGSVIKTSSSCLARVLVLSFTCFSVPAAEAEGIFELLRKFPVDMEVLPATFAPNITTVLLPRGLTPGIAGQLFSVIEWILTIVGGLLFLRLLRSMISAHFLPLPQNLRQAILTTELFTEGKVGGIGSFARLSYHLYSGWERSGLKQSLAAASPILVSLSLITGIILVNVSQSSMKNVILKVEHHGQVTLPTSGWLLNGSLSDTSKANEVKRIQTVDAAEIVKGYRYARQVTRMWTALSANGYSEETGLYVKDGILCARPTEGTPAKNKVDIENATYCEGFTATCSPLEDLRLAYGLNGWVELEDAKKPAYLRDRISDESWANIVQNISLPGWQMDDLYGFRGAIADQDVQEVTSISVIATLVWTLKLNKEGVESRTAKKVIIGTNSERKKLSLLANSDYLLPGKGFTYAYAYQEGAMSTTYSMWLGECKLELRRGIIAPAAPSSELPIVKNWTGVDYGVLQYNPILRFNPEFTEGPASDLTDNAGSTLKGALKTAVVASDTSEGLDGGALAEAILARGVNAWLLAQSTGGFGNSVSVHASWQTRENRIMLNMLWAVLGFGLYGAVLVSALIFWICGFCLHGGDREELSHMEQNVDNTSTTWGLVRGSILLTQREGSGKEEEGPPIALLKSEKDVLQEAKEWSCTPVLVDCGYRGNKPSQIPALALKKRKPFEP